MKKLIISILLALAILFVNQPINASTYNAPKQNFDVKTDTFFDSLETHLVSIFSVGDGLGRCSGIVVGCDGEDSCILTCKHCITLLEDNYVEDKKVKLIIASADDDLAYMIVDGILKDKKPVDIATSRLKKEETVYHVGYPNFVGMYKSKGTFNRYSSDWGWANLLIIPGCSGGGLFNKKGELVGITWGYFENDEENITIFEPAHDILRFLERVKEYTND